MGNLDTWRTMSATWQTLNRKEHGKSSKSAGEERCERGLGQVCANLMSWRPKRIRRIAAMWAQRTYLRIQEFSIVGGYTENPEKPLNGQNWGMGTCSGQYGTWRTMSVMWQTLNNRKCTFFISLTNCSHYVNSHFVQCLALAQFLSSEV